jgi:hypothetical protein
MAFDLHSPELMALLAAILASGEEAPSHTSTIQRALTGANDIIQEVQKGM